LILHETRGYAPQQLVAAPVSLADAQAHVVSIGWL
jgi:hypothetical protein